MLGGTGEILQKSLTRVGSQNPSGLRTNPARTTLPTRRGQVC